MVSLSAIHAVTIELHGGMLALAAFCLLTILFGAFYKRTIGRKTKRLHGFLQKAAEYAEPTAYIAAIGGIIGLILSSISGYLITTGTFNSPSEALVNSPIMMNKIMVSVIALEMWIAFVIIRSWYGKGLWNVRSLALSYIIIGLTAFTFTMVAGSMGGHMTGKGSILDPLLELIGISYTQPWVIGMEAAYIVMILVNIFLVSYIIFYIYTNRMIRRRPMEDLEDSQERRWRNGR
jgi:hypothetical protein